MEMVQRPVQNRPPLEMRDRLIAVHAYDNIFPREAIRHLNALADARAHAAKPGGVVHEDAKDQLALEVRRSKVLRLPATAEHLPLYQLVSQIIDHANQTVFRYELAGLWEQLQLATYTAEDSGFYDWHVDIGAGPLSQRKLSLIVPLTDPAEYEGGDFEVFYERGPQRVELPLGRVIAFPSYLLHRVTPLTRGVRRSLAVWVTGPPYR